MTTPIATVLRPVFAMTVAALPILGSGGCATTDDQTPMVVTNDLDRLSYGVGYTLGVEVDDGLTYDEIDANIDLVLRGFTDGLERRGPLLPHAEMDAVLAAVHERMAERRVERLLAEDPEYRALHDGNLAKSEAFHAEYGQRNDVITMVNSIQYRVVREGDGTPPGLDDTIVVTFRATLIDGSQVVDGDRAEFVVREIVTGARHVVQQMNVGAHWEVALPPSQAHGAAGDPPLIGPNETILIDVELHEIQRDPGTRP